MVPDLVQSFAEDRTSVLFFAYGQTGTGKTRTMLGTEPSLQSATPHEDWGVFPRVWAATCDKVAERRAAGQRCVLTGSAIEFYLGECYDLLSSSDRHGNAPVQIDFETHTPSGESCSLSSSPLTDGLPSARHRQPHRARHQLNMRRRSTRARRVRTRRSSSRSSSTRRRASTARPRSPSSTSRARSGPRRCERSRRCSTQRPKPRPRAAATTAT